MTRLSSFSSLSCFVQISGASVEETLTGEVILSVLKVTVNKPALYTCLASNRHSAGANTVKATARVTVAGTFSFRRRHIMTSLQLSGLCVCVCVFGGRHLMLATSFISLVWLQLFAAPQPPFGKNLSHDPQHTRPQSPKNNAHTHVLADHTHCPSVSSESVREAPWLVSSSSWDSPLSFVCLLSSPLSSSWCIFCHRLLDTATSP